MPLTAENLFTKADLQDIDKVLYQPISEELKHRIIFPNLATNFNPEAEEIGYDIYDRTGSAKIFAGRAVANDIPFVGDKKDRPTQAVHEIATGIAFTRAERAASAAARGLGTGAAIPLDMLRVETARRFINEIEAKLVWVGDSTYGIKGILDSTFYGETGLGSLQFVGSGATGNSPAQKKLWLNKSSQEIIIDLIEARTVVGTDGIFNARNLVLPHKHLLRLEKPYGADNATLLKDVLLGTSGGEGYFDTIEGTNYLDSTNNGLSYDAFMVFDNRPQVGQIAVVKEMETFPPKYDLTQNSQQAIILRSGGWIMRHPAAFAVRKGI